MKTKLEVCIDDLNGIQACVNGKADRIELCSSLEDGGLTPSIALMSQASLFEIPVRVMIRPRNGNFHYSSLDIENMLNEIDIARSFGFEGVVFGATLKNGMLDQVALKLLCEHAAGLKKTLHRAIDTISDPISAVDIAINLGFDFILSSGGAITAEKGLSVLQDMKRVANCNIEIMPGAGVNVSNAQKIASSGKFKWLHSSCSSKTHKKLNYDDLVTKKSYTDTKKIISLRDALN